MKLEVFENVIQKELKLLRKVVLSIGTAFCLILVLVLYSKQNLFFQRGDVLKERPLASFVCSEAFMSIVGKKPTDVLVTDEILNALKKDEFKVVAEEVLLTQIIEENKCRIIVKGDEKVRSFLIDLEANKKNTFYYKLSEINETEIYPNEVNRLEKEQK
jgi:hypothetical protein